MIDRKEFIKKCGYACIGGLFIPSILQSCSSIKLIERNRVNAEMEGSDLVVPVSSFDNGDNKKLYIIVHHPKLNYPVCVYCFGEGDYSALLMACTHQGTELQVFGEKLECPAHGSEFDSKGLVENGPAEENLRSFPLRIENGMLKISLAVHA